MQINNKLRFVSGHSFPVYMQSEASECGLACLAMVGSFYGSGTSLTELRQRFPVSLKGMTLDHLVEVADQISLSARPLRLELDELRQLKIPCLLHWNMNHFVVLKSVNKGGVTIVDPGFGELTLPFKTVSESFTGVAVEFTPKLDFVRKPTPSAIDISKVVGRVIGLKRGLIQLFILAVILESIAILTPMLNQWITDEAIGSGEQELLGLLCLGIVLLGVTQAGISLIRNWIGLYISTSFSLQWMSNVMMHLLRLPIEFFERRHLGDIVNRFSAVKTIEHMLTTALVDVLLDGLLATATLVMMFIYYPALAAISIVVVVTYALIRWGRYNAVRIANQGLVIKQSLEQTYFLETIRGVRSIKLFNREYDRKSNWINRLVAVTNADLTLQKLNFGFNTVWSLLSAIERGLVFWLGASAVIDGKMTLGMFFAFLSYKEQFTSRVSVLVDRFVDFKMLGVQTERLADIVMAAPEEQLQEAAHEVPVDLTLKLRNLTFRYGPSERELLSDINISVMPGECVVIVGPSGEGKTTLLKLMMSILLPSSGSISLGGVSIRKLGLRNYREFIGTVLQDDQLYAGSIADNISFFSNDPDLEWIKSCARSASIYEEIAAMPMGFHTLVGDMGTVLSGGQKQRIMVARALYKRPAVLFFDEATSHLDSENERLISEAIAALAITRIMVAHRPQTVAIADRVLRLHRGKLSELRRANNSATVER